MPMGGASASRFVARMKRLSRMNAGTGRAVAGRRGSRRVLRAVLFATLGALILVALPAGLAFLRLSMGPVSFAGLADRAAQAIEARVGEGWRVDVGGAAIELLDGGLALRATSLDIRNPAGALVVRAPDAIVSMGTASLLTGALVARSIEFRDLQLDASLDRTGALTFVPAGEEPPVATTATPPDAAASPEAPPGGAQDSPVSRAVVSLFDHMIGSSGVIGALDRAKLTNARLRILGEDRKERASFRNVSATFARDAPDLRRFDLRLDGSAGGWRLQGEVRVDGEGRREGSVEATDVPIQDVLLFAGLSGLPVAIDARLTGQLGATVADARLTRLEGRFSTGRGIIQIDDKDMPPVGLEAASAQGSWDEEQRTLALKDLTFRNGETTVRLSGAVNAPAGQPWRVELGGRDAVLAAVVPGDAAVALDTIEVAASGQGDGLTLDKLELHGPTLNASMNGAYGVGADPKALEVNIFAESAKARSFLRLWPDLVVPKVRQYLLANLRGGTVETLSISVALSGRDLAGAFSDQPVPDGSVRVDFSIVEGLLHINDGLPPLARLGVAGSVTGTRAEVRATTGAVQTAGGRVLAVTDGVFSLPQIWSANADSRIAFRLDGGVDAVASLLQTPTLRSVTGALELDPAQVRGQADLSVKLDLPIKNIPEFADLAVAISGTMTGVGIDKAFGKERLENGQLSVNYTAGSLAIRGEGRLNGTASIIDIRQPRNLPGEATISFSLDEAARARKGIALGPGLTGALPVRVVAPLGKGKSGARVEVDLTRATIDNLLPGWTKPPGRAGRLSFVAQEGGGEIRDVVLESGPVQMRGSATMSGEGQLERVDLSTFKLSPGDDMRVQVERSGSLYRATVRGNVADARPFIRGFTSPPAAGGARESREIDLDLGVNILTGFNDEALTNASLKLGLRGKDLRQLQLAGRFRSATVSAQLSRAERGAPSVMVQSRDAGATLRFLDIYRRMAGGELAFQISMNDGPQRGSVTMSSFALKNEPALRRIVSQQPQAAVAEDRAANARAPQVDPNEVFFNTLKADFSRTASRLEFRDAVLFGQQVGFTLGGWIDYAKSLTDISGTFVPAYGLNNAFAQVPLFGPILTGGQNEGVFAVNFRVAGSASAPTLTVNPLSAVAPGFLRKILGAIGAAADEVAGAAGANGGAAAPPQPSR